MIALNKEARQAILKAGRNFDGDIILLAQKVLDACGIDEYVVKEDVGYDPYCDDPDCGACNGIGADGHHFQEI